MRWAASDVSPSSHLAFHIPNTCRFLCCVVFVALSCFCFLFCKCFGIPNSPRSLDLDDRQGLIASSAMQQKKKATGPEEWELIPVGHNMPPAVILEDIARVYRDIGDHCSALTWWLCRIHESSVLSAMPTWLRKLCSRSGK